MHSDWLKQVMWLFNESDCVISAREHSLTSLYITVRLTSCSTGWDLAKQANLFIVSIQQNSLIQTSQTGGQPYSDISPYEGKWVFSVSA